MLFEEAKAPEHDLVIAAAPSCLPPVSLVTDMCKMFVKSLPPLCIALIESRELAIPRRDVADVPLGSHRVWPSSRSGVKELNEIAQMSGPRLQDGPENWGRDAAREPVGGHVQHGHLVVGVPSTLPDLILTGHRELVAAV